MKNKAVNNIIDTSSPGIVVQETSITITDEKVKGILLRTYEAALKNANSFKYYKSYKVLLSVAGTLFLSLLTSDFRNLGKLDASTVTTIAWVVMVLCALIGFLFLGIASHYKMIHDTVARDKAISDIFENYVSKDE